MLKFYFSTSVIWLVINLSLIFFYKDKLIANGWAKVNSNPDITKLIAALLMISVVPIFRVIMGIMTMVMATYTLKEFEEWAERVKEEK